MSRRQDRFPFFQSYQPFLPQWDRLPNCTLFLATHRHARERNREYLTVLWKKKPPSHVRESVDFLSLASGPNACRSAARSPKFLELSDKAWLKLNGSNLAVIQRAATTSDRSDLKPPWLTASGQTAILLHSGGGGEGIRIGSASSSSRQRRIAPWYNPRSVLSAGPSFHWCQPDAPTLS